MASYKTSEAQRRATKKWEKRNPERKRYLRSRSDARTFVRHLADDEDVAELLEIYKNENPNARKKEGWSPLLLTYGVFTIYYIHL